MKRIWKLTNASNAELLLQKSHKPSFKTLIPTLPNLSNPSPTHRFIKHTPFCDNTTNTTSSTIYPTLLNLFTAKQDECLPPELFGLVSELIEELLTHESNSPKIIEILQSKASTLVPPAPILLLKGLKPWPQLALKVFNWRRKEFPLVAEEYSAGITIAGRLNNVDLAAALFQEAVFNGLQTTSTYNALMAAYMYNGLGAKAQSLFRDLKLETAFGPNIVTYNIILSILGRLMLVDHMEATLKEIEDMNLTPNLNTYNHVIAGYVTAWMWEDMERMYRTMERSSSKPDLTTHVLMLRGYAHSGNLEKMEMTYGRIKHHVDENSLPLIRAMICAYCKSSNKDRVTKVEALLKLVPEEEYRPWLNVILIRLYAEEDLVDAMEGFIAQALKHNTTVTTVGIMRSIIASYFRSNAVERFLHFLKLAEASNWRICRSLYHCKLVMFSATNRLEEMGNVLEEMKKYNLCPTKKTFLIMYRAYSERGHRCRVEKILGTMYKHGFEIPLDAFPS